MVQDSARRRSMPAIAGRGRLAMNRRCALPVRAAFAGAVKGLNPLRPVEV
jgi:hypothetical protein